MLKTGWTLRSWRQAPLWRCGIRRKILIAMLVITSLALLLFLLLASWGIRSLGGYALQRNLGLGSDAIRISKTALQEQAERGLLHLAESQADLCDADFYYHESDVRVLAEAVSLLLDGREKSVLPSSHTARQRPADTANTSVVHIPQGIPAAALDPAMDWTSGLDSLTQGWLESDAFLAEIMLGLDSGLFRRLPWTDRLPADYDARHREWYRRAVETRKPSWSGPFIDAETGDLQISCSQPVLRNDRVVAVVGISMWVKTIAERIMKVNSTATAQAVLVDHQQRVLARRGMTASSRLWSDPQKLEIFRFDRQEQQTALMGYVTASKPGVLRGEIHGKDTLVSCAPVKSTDWVVLVLLPMEVIYAPMLPPEKAIQEATRQVSERMENRILFVTVLLTLFFLAMLVLVLLLSGRIASQITAPLIQLDTGAKAIGSGALDYRIPIPDSGDEVEALARTFEKMTEDLRIYVRNLTETTAAKERMESELHVAYEVQTSLLPKIFPPFPERREFEIYARMDPAKEVGGDFFDFFLLGENRLCFLIADVSDKGVPAALYMMVAKILLKAEAGEQADPGEILEKVNRVLANNNENCMFVTVFCCILDFRSGAVEFANAGHNPPAHYRRGQNFLYLRPKVGFVLGPLADSRYETETLQLQPGDYLFLYTDGVTEARSRAEGLFGESRLLDALSRQEPESAVSLVQRIRAEVERHSHGVPQSDDMTLLALKFNGL